MTTELPPSLLTLFLAGATMGLTACTATCLPFFGTWALGRGGGGWVALRDTGWFLSGKLLAYTLLGAGAGGLGRWLITTLDGQTGQLVIGSSSLLAGCWMIAQANRARPPSHHPSGTDQAACRTARTTAHYPPVLLGFSLSLIPCAPLTALLAAGVQSESTWLGASYGAAFGLGTALTPLLIILPVLGFLGGEANRDRPWLARHTQTAAGAVLLLLGLNRLYLGS
ncbi:MAG: sulfite exporter TauE/SafE family protein [Magnetococcus sp. DMHC-8]